MRREQMELEKIAQEEKQKAANDLMVSFLTL
jgi:hypothetical protein